MNSALRCGSVLLVFCLLCSGATPVGGDLAQEETTGNQVTITPNTNGTNYLSPINPDTEGYAQVDTDVSSAASIAAQRIHSEHDSRSLEAELNDANQSQRENIAEARINRIESRFEEIAQEQEDLHDAYAAGELSERDLFRTLLTQRIVIQSQIDNYERAVTNTNLDIERLSQLETLADGLTPEQPVVALAEQALVTDEQQIVYVQASGEGLVLGTVADHQFTRQATVLDERDFDGRDQFKLAQNITIGDDGWATPAGYSEAYERLEELYPWAYDRRRVDAGEINTLSRIYSLNVPNPQGELTTYFDSATQNVFHENQVGFVESYTLEATIDNSTDSLRVSLGLTHQSGPLRVTVEDGGRAVEDATVRIDGAYVGSTDDDGTLWTVQPLSGFEVTTTTPAGENASISFP